MHNRSAERNEDDVSAHAENDNELDGSKDNT